VDRPDCRRVCCATRVSSQQQCVHTRAAVSPLGPHPQARSSPPTRSWWCSTPTWWQSTTSLSGGGSWCWACRAQQLLRVPACKTLVQMPRQAGTRRAVTHARGVHVACTAHHAQGAGGDGGRRHRAVPDTAGLPQRQRALRLWCCGRVRGVHEGTHVRKPCTATRRRPRPRTHLHAAPLVACTQPRALRCSQHATDIFNNLNLSFWEYMLPGTDAYR
jgi:hypothetical protein